MPNQDHRTEKIKADLQEHIDKMKPGMFWKWLYQILWDLADTAVKHSNELYNTEHPNDREHFPMELVRIKKNGELVRYGTPNKEPDAH